MRVVPCLGLVALCLTLTGCTTFGKKPSVGANPPGPAGGQRADRSAPQAPPAPVAGARPQPGAPAGQGLLAGQVIDGSSTKPPPAFIQLVAAKEQGEAGAPIEVAADSQGYFTIQGLQPGRHYQLTARARDGNKVLAGMTWATPPNPRVVIRISEDYATPSTPGLPPPPAWQGGKGQPKGNPAASPGVQIIAPRPSLPNANTGADRGWSPIPNAGRTGPLITPERPAGLGPPIRDDAPKVTAPRPEDIAGVARNDPKDIPVLIPGDPYGNSPISTPIPSCSLTGKQLSNFALYDLNGQPWEYRKNHGRLTLVDFWGTWCGHCMQSIPQLNILQQQYGNRGLEVVGIAYEDGPLQAQVEKVNRVRQLKNINYTLLLGSDRVQCPVMRQFEVASWPTLVLIDDNGRIIWRAVGIDRQKLAELEFLIRQRLGA